MRVIGLVLFLFGVLTLVDAFMTLGIGALAWVNNWGEGAAWGIRIGATLIGLLLLAKGGKKGKK